MNHTPAGYCPKCDYRIDPGRCPECGTVVTRPWRKKPSAVRRRRRWAALIALAIVAIVAVVGWRFGPTWAERYTPSSILIWISDGKLGFGAQWATNILRARVQTTYTAFGYPGLNLEKRLRFDWYPRPDGDWKGNYARGQMRFLGGDQLLLAGDDLLWSFSEGMQPGALIVGRISQFNGETLTLEIPGDPALRHWRDTVFGPLRPSLPAKLTLVCWANWRYLIADDELIDFCNDVNAGEPLDEYHLTRPPGDRQPDDDWRGRPIIDEPPTVPAHYQCYLLRAAITANAASCEELAIPPDAPIPIFVTAVRSQSFSPHVYHVRWNSDNTARLLPGMRLYPSDRNGMGYVVSNQDGTAHGIYVELQAASTPPPQPINAMFSTLAPFGTRTDMERGFILQTYYSQQQMPPIDLSTSQPSPADIAVTRRGLPMTAWLLRKLASSIYQHESAATQP